jgi:hypothetical protein
MWSCSLSYVAVCYRVQFNMFHLSLQNIAVLDVFVAISIFLCFNEFMKLTIAVLNGSCDFFLINYLYFAGK